MICCHICGGRMRQAAESGKEETTADFRCAAIRLYLTVGNFSSHTQWSLTITCIDNSAAWAAKKKCVTTTSVRWTTKWTFVFSRPAQILFSQQ